MFEDRSKTGYNFEKLDKYARTQVIVENTNSQSQNQKALDAHKKLFGPKEETPKQELKQQIKEELISPKSSEHLNNLPSSSYLKQFENQIVEEVEPSLEEENKIKTDEVNFESLIESSDEVEVNNKVINKELKTIAPKPKKNYSFRIKLVSGVYCILVALFGGWVIGNTINISDLNTSLYETTNTTETVNANILEIISNINNLNNATSNPEDETIVVKIITEEIEINPEPITEPNEYQESSNWFDVFCNWISSIFGG